MCPLRSKVAAAVKVGPPSDKIIRTYRDGADPREQVSVSGYRSIGCIRELSKPSCGDYRTPRRAACNDLLVHSPRARLGA
ncbi:hypothetical protein GCM10023319_49920 [Nocardia iowensis]